MIFFLFLSCFGNRLEQAPFKVYPFGEKGFFKMLYDQRQRPQSVRLGNKIYIVYNAGAAKDTSDTWLARPMITSFDLENQTFTQPVVLGPSHEDHHYGPVIWADHEGYLHILYGCHKTPGTHLISQTPAREDFDLKDWKEATPIASSISYPSFFKLETGAEMIYYREMGHIGSWTYQLSADNGRSWSAPEVDVTEDYLDSEGVMNKHGGGRIEEWTSGDEGESWKFSRDLTPNPSTYQHWKFNNIRPVTKQDGSHMDNLFLFYGWKEDESYEGRGFLLQVISILK